MGNGSNLGFQVRLRISAHEVGGAVDSVEEDGMRDEKEGDYG